jgi:hypothetical protein
VAKVATVPQTARQPTGRGRHSSLVGLAHPLPDSVAVREAGNLFHLTFAL